MYRVVRAMTMIQIVGIKGAERPHWVIRQERQYNQRGGSEDQGIPDLIVA